MAAANEPTAILYLDLSTRQPDTGEAMPVILPVLDEEAAALSRRLMITDEVAITV